LNTNYTNDFTAKQGQRAQAIRPHNRKLDGATDMDDTTYGQDFRKWAGDRRGLIKADISYNGPGVPFEGQSTYKGHYVGHESGPASTFKPSNAVYNSGRPIVGDTMYRSEYTQKEIAPCSAALLVGLNIKRNHLNFCSKQRVVFEI
jgi:hypothetical protein